MNGKHYDINEAILMFDTAELAQITEVSEKTSAKGGYHNINLIDWEIDKEVNFGIKH